MALIRRSGPGRRRVRCRTGPRAGRSPARRSRPPSRRECGRRGRGRRGRAARRGRRPVRPAASSRSRRAAWVWRDPSAPKNPRPWRSPSTSTASKAGSWSSRTSTSASEKPATAARASSRSVTWRAVQPSSAACAASASPIAPTPTTSTVGTGHPQVEQQVRTLHGRCVSVTVAPRRAGSARVSAAASSSASVPSEPCTSASSGPVEDECGGTVRGRDAARPAARAPVRCPRAAASGAGSGWASRVAPPLQARPAATASSSATCASRVDGGAPVASAMASGTTVRSSAPRRSTPAMSPSGAAVNSWPASTVPNPCRSSTRTTPMVPAPPSIHRRSAAPRARCCAGADGGSASRARHHEPARRSRRAG